MFARQNVPWAFLVSAYDAEESPDLVRDILRSGIEIGSHGYLHEGIDPGDAELELLERTNLLAGTIVIENVFYLPGLRRLIFPVDRQSRPHRGWLGQQDHARSLKRDTAIGASFKEPAERYRSTGKR
jgi:peptidoglycan/xylan/chitin deacetylase (PgdA/CDA1 family)